MAVTSPSRTVARGKRLRACRRKFPGRVDVVTGRSRQRLTALSWTDHVGLQSDGLRSICAARTHHKKDPWILDPVSTTCGPSAREPHVVVLRIDRKDFRSKLG